MKTLPEKTLNSLIYGPVPSWRLGRSLGIDLLSTSGKTCSFNCIYCQLGKTAHYTTERQEFVPLERIGQELQAAKDVPADWLTFSGMGEPTLASNLGQAIEIAREILKLPIAVLTNSSLMTRWDVRQELARADLVIAKLDAPDEERFRLINRPFGQPSLVKILEGIKLFGQENPGKLALQIMFMDQNKEQACELARLATEISPVEIQLNTPLRPCPVRPLSREQMSRIKQEFESLPARILMVYETPRPEVSPLSLEQTLRRRIKL